MNSRVTSCLVEPKLGYNPWGNRYTYYVFILVSAMYACVPSRIRDHAYLFIYFSKINATKYTCIRKRVYIYIYLFPSNDAFNSMHMHRYLVTYSINLFRYSYTCVWENKTYVWQDRDSRSLARASCVRVPDLLCILRPSV